MFEGRTITAIVLHGDRAEQPISYDLWTQGGIITLEKEEDTRLITEAINQAIKENIDIKAHVANALDALDADKYSSEHNL